MCHAYMYVHEHVYGIFISCKCMGNCHRALREGCRIGALMNKLYESCWSCVSVRGEMIWPKSSHHLTYISIDILETTCSLREHSIPPRIPQ